MPIAGVRPSCVYTYLSCQVDRACESTERGYVNNRDSGGGVVCVEPGADHITTATPQHHYLAHVAQRFPSIGPYNCMPIGSKGHLRW